MNTPEGINVENIGKVVVIEGTRTDGGSQKTVFVGKLESFTTLGESYWLVILSGGLKVQSDYTGKYEYRVVAVSEPTRSFTQINNH